MLNREEFGAHIKMISPKENFRSFDQEIKIIENVEKFVDFILI
jgi:hypothetical protein